MSDHTLRCPACEHPASFDLTITGRQENARLVDADDDGDPTVAQADAVVVNEYDEESLLCRNCGTTVAESELLQPAD